MKILQVMPDFELAGAQTMCENLIMELIKDEKNIVEVISFYNFNSDITKRLEMNKIKIYYLGKKKGFDIKLFFNLKKVIDTFQPDVIHTHRYALEYVVPILKFCKKKDIKIIHTVHNIAEKEVPKILQFFQAKWFKSKRVTPIAISELVRDSIVKRYRLNIKNIPLVYNGINLERCKIKENYKFNNNLLHIGRFSEQKNHEELLECFAECLKVNSDLKLYLVGNGEKKSKIEEKVKKMNLQQNVIFMGTMPNCYEIMSKADIFLLPSKWEGMPMTLIEAMATGLVCIAYPVGGIPNMIKDGITGSLPKNPMEMSKCILKYASNEELRERVGKNARKQSNMFSSDIMCNKYLDIYKQ